MFVLVAFEIFVDFRLFGLKAIKMPPVISKFAMIIYFIGTFLMLTLFRLFSFSLMSCSFICDVN